MAIGRPILVSAQPQTATDDVMAALAVAGLSHVPHLLRSPPAVHFEEISAAIICPGEILDAAIEQTRRWRIELGSHYVPIVWILSMPSVEWKKAGLDAGADVCLSQPFDPGLLVSQLAALQRIRQGSDQLSLRAAEASVFAERLQKAYGSIDRDVQLARTIHRSLIPTKLPDSSELQFGVHYRPRSRAGGDFFNVHPTPTGAEFYLADIVAAGGASGGVLSLFVNQAIRTHASGNEPTPSDVLGQVNRSLLQLQLNDPPIASLIWVRANGETGKVAFAKASVTQPIHVPKSGDIEAWTASGTLLSVADSAYPTQYGQLHPGDKLLLASDGTIVDSASATGVLSAAAALHRNLPAQAFVDAVAHDLLRNMRQADDFTLLVVERQVTTT